MDEILHVALKDLHDVGVEIAPGDGLCDLEYADDIICLFESAESAQLVLDKLGEAVKPFGMRFAPSKCKVLLQDWVSPTPSLKLDTQSLDIVDSFTYLGSVITNDGSIDGEMGIRITKARAAYAGLRHLWRNKNVSLKIKGRVYNASVRSVLMYGCETWSLRSEDTRRLEAFDHRCLRQLAGVRFEDRVSNAEVRNRVLGDKVGEKALGHRIELSRLRWLGHVLRMQSSRRPNRTLFTAPGVGLKKPRGGQKMTWPRGMKVCTANPGKVGASVRLPGWGPKDEPTKWLETLGDMAMNRPQWRSCCHFLSGLSV